MEADLAGSFQPVDGEPTQGSAVPEDQAALHVMEVDPEVDVGDRVVRPVGDAQVEGTTGGDVVLAAGGRRVGVTPVMVTS